MVEWGSLWWVAYYRVSEMCGVYFLFRRDEQSFHLPYLIKEGLSVETPMIIHERNLNDVNLSFKKNLFLGS